MKQKYLLMIVVLGICTAFLTSCTTLISNRAGFDHRRDETQENRERPQWLTERLASGENHWEEQGYHFFLGSSTPTPFSLITMANRDRRRGWTQNEARRAAENDVTMQIADKVGMEIEITIQGDLSIRGDESREQHDETFRMQTNIFIQGRRVTHFFYEVWEYRRFRRFRITHFWMVVSVPDTVIQDAQRISYELRTGIITREILEGVERDVFERERENFERVINILAENFTNDDDETFEREYIQLLTIHSVLEGLSTLEEYANYQALMYELTRAITTYNPARMRALVLSSLRDQNTALQKQIAYLEGRLYGRGEFTEFQEAIDALNRRLGEGGLGREERPVAIPTTSGPSVPNRRIIYRFSPDTLEFLYCADTEAARLDDLARTLSLFPGNTFFLLEGHAAAVGTPMHEMALSYGRARRIGYELEQRGICPNRLLFDAWGGTRPLRSNATEQGRRFNRRVEITVLE